MRTRSGIERLIVVDDHAPFGDEQPPPVKNDFVNIDEHPQDGYTALTRFDQLMDLSDEVLGHILFSGYLSRSWYQTVLLLLVCKRFAEVGKRHIAYVDHKCRDWHGPVNVSAIQNLENIHRIAGSLVYLDLSFCNINLQSFQNINLFKQWKNSLKGLNLRGTGLCDEFLQHVGLSGFTQLKFLDVSKLNISEAPQITDVGGYHIAGLTRLKWLNVSCTSITNDTVGEISSKCPMVWHLGLQCCLGFTDDGVKYLKRMGHLRILDISGCSLITVRGTNELIGVTDSKGCDHGRSSSIKFPLQSNLSVLSISFLPDTLPRGPLITALLDKYRKLTKLEMRKRNEDEIDTELISEVRKKLDVCVLSHTDQLKLVKGQSIIETIPTLVELCPIFSWPYHNPGI